MTGDVIEERLADVLDDRAEREADYEQAVAVVRRSLELLEDLEREMRDLPEVLDIVRNLADELED
jgi:hypothetical protein